VQDNERVKNYSKLTYHPETYQLLNIYYIYSMNTLYIFQIQVYNFLLLLYTCKPLCFELLSLYCDEKIPENEHLYVNFYSISFVQTNETGT